VNVNESGPATLDKASFGDGTWVTVAGAKRSDWLAASGTIDIAKGYAAGSIKVTHRQATFPANRSLPLSNYRCLTCGLPVRGAARHLHRTVQQPSAATNTLSAAIVVTQWTEGAQSAVASL
jgi:hypothetical protein